MTAVCNDAVEGTVHIARSDSALTISACSFMDGSDGDRLESARPTSREQFVQSRSTESAAEMLALHDRCDIGHLHRAREPPVIHEAVDVGTVPDVTGIQGVYGTNWR